MEATQNFPVSNMHQRVHGAMKFLGGIVRVAEEERKAAQIGDLDTYKEHIYSEAERGNHLPLFAHAISSSQEELLKVMIHEFFSGLKEAGFKGKMGISWNDYLRPQIVCLVNFGDWDAESLVYDIEASVNAKLTDFGMKLDTIVMEAPEDAEISEEFTEIVF